MLDVAGAIAELNGIDQIFHYDAYGQAIGFVPSQAATEFLFSGEQFDAKIGQQYLRARYYDPATGRFNRLDPFFGNATDPQSLHNYLYCHADPINGIDPSGNMTLGSCISAIGIGLNMVSFSYNMAQSQTAYANGDSAKANEHMAWALVDLVFLCIPFVGPGASGGLHVLVTAGGPVRYTLYASAITLSKVGIKVGAIYGYLTATAHALLGSYSYATSGGGGSGSGGSSGGGGGSGGTPQTNGSWTGEKPFHMSDASRKYQKHIAETFGDMPPANGAEFNLHDKYFDGISSVRKAFLEAKGNYDFLFNSIWKSPTHPTYVAEVDKMVEHAKIARQYGYKLEYYVAQESTVVHWEKMAIENGVADVVTVTYVPAP